MSTTKTSTILLFIQKEDLILVLTTPPSNRYKNWFLRLSPLICRQLKQANIDLSTEFFVELYLPESKYEYLFGLVFQEIDKNTGQYILQGHSILERVLVELEDIKNIKAIIKRYEEYLLSYEFAISEIKDILETNNDPT